MFHHFFCRGLGPASKCQGCSMCHASHHAPLHQDLFLRTCTITLTAQSISLSSYPQKSTSKYCCLEWIGRKQKPRRKQTRLQNWTLDPQDTYHRNFKHWRSSNILPHHKRSQRIARAGANAVTPPATPLRHCSSSSHQQRERLVK